MTKREKYAAFILGQRDYEKKVRMRDVGEYPIEYRRAYSAGYKFALIEGADVNVFLGYLEQLFEASKRG
jgi:hypothetical protein